MGEFGELTRLAATQGGFVTAGQALRLGVGREQIRYLVRSGRWTRISRGCYLPSPAGPVALRRAMIRAAIASIGPGAVAVLGTAAELHGIAGLPPTAAIHVSVPPHRPHVQRRAEPSLTVHQLTLGDADVCRADGVPVTTPARTVADVLLRARRYPAVCVLDSALNQGILAENDMSLVLAYLAGRRGAVAAREFLAEADGRAQSPLETRARLRCVDGGVPPEVLQLPVRDDDGYLLGVGDLAWRGARLIAEADGRAPHLTPEAVYADRFRQNRLVNAGWRILRFTWSDTLRPDYIPQTVKHALRQSPKRR
ncbi:type IV toxin-antitoxin system AbiEi family antitoxin domain-containing protein [Micromonospora sp. WMMA1976]|uniref:type IV toxin-antitoxin system AbiEi family antitoxin domain-containing protein n=1 Tax=unclassified Micromonospora TaxID=2617518 RepID=UPI0018904114|nr:type IV toxin-antitoxin system AbiEi family antitoxin domain-containing protein [Micromonospora sp. WMMA1976]MBF5030065.1 type IV toxin-antitoxin system AbiEi family antitoxin domain-containing protein [Micromonospora sp. ANENR4]WBC03214.1 type IV toxin-antitoxin system AbiEi family antitoxin domain-containing protein [Micromonospora sp. WMMA1976]